MWRKRVTYDAFLSVGLGLGSKNPKASSEWGPFLSGRKKKGTKKKGQLLFLASS